MMFKTHIVIGVFLTLVFLPFINYKLIFIPLVILSSLMPDIDSMNSYLGRHWIFRPIQIFIKHRDLLHSFSFIILLSSIFAFYLPVASFPLFLGYSGHLLADALTIEGIRPFWPLKDRIEGKIKTGGKFEDILFYFLIGVNILLILLLI